MGELELELNYHCEYCPKIFISRCARDGHLAHCATLKSARYCERNGANQFEYINYQNIMEFDDDNEVYDLEEVLNGEFELELDKYLKHQRQFLSLAGLKQLETGYIPLLSGGKRMKADMETYLLLCKFVANCRSLSGPEADGLVQLAKRITYISGHEIPLPQSFRTLQRNVLYTLTEHKIEIEQTLFQLPAEMFGDNPHNRKFKHGTLNTCLLHI